MLKNRDTKKRLAVLSSYCAIVIALLATLPWIDWARHGGIWVANLAGLPVLPAFAIVIRRRGWRWGAPAHGLSPAVGQ